MDRSDVIYLIDFRHEQQADYTFLSPEETLAIAGVAIVGRAVVGNPKEVYCDVKSITQTEWFEAGRNGIEHPAFVFIIYSYEYSGEEIVEYEGQLYGVFRTYRGRNEDLELHCEAKGGLHTVEEEEPEQGVQDGNTENQS